MKTPRKNIESIVDTIVNNNHDADTKPLSVLRAALVSFPTQCPQLGVAFMKKRYFLKTSAIAGLVAAALSGAAFAANPVLKIGFVGVTSGPAASWGISNQRSMETRAAWINETGGVKIGGTTYDVKVVAFDDQKDPKRAIAGMEKMAQEGLEVDEDGFRRLMKEQRNRAQADAKLKKSGHTDLSEYRKIADEVGTSEFIGYTHIDSDSTVDGILVDGISVKSATEGSDVEIVLNRTPFYAEGGGQLADGGRITLASGAVIEIFDVQSPVKGLSIHRGRVLAGEISLGESAHAAIDLERRNAISRAHTATHMVHKAFREILGETATQAGSENSPGRFRFDFPSTGSVSEMVLSEVEARVNTLLLDNLAVSAEVMSQEAAKKIGAMALFGEKYGDQVRVVSVGDWARELCGGTHVRSSGELGVVKLLGESSIGAGVRRVEALVGADAYSFLAREHILLNSLTSLIKGSKVEELPERIQALIDRVKDIEKELATVRTAQAMASIDSLASQAVAIGEIVFTGALLPDGVSADDLRKISLEIRNRNSHAVVALISSTDGKPVLVATCSDEARKLGFKAGALVKVGSSILGGGGGGKDDFAQGGGTDSSAAKAALDAVAASLAGK